MDKHKKQADNGWSSTGCTAM